MKREARGRAGAMSITTSVLVGSSSESGQAAGQPGTVATKTRVSTQFDDDDRHDDDRHDDQKQS